VLSLPTDNRAIFEDDGPGFYQVTERYFEGERTWPWEGGQYGFVRNAVRRATGVVYTRFHEGIDIRPLTRDARGEPLDDVRSVSDGRVVYVNASARASNYGRYVVVEYDWQGARYYGLYAHLATTDVYVSQFVRRGERLGRLGYTGEGIDRDRAHVHFELNMLLSERFDEWLRRYSPRERNEHGRYSGLNMAGFSPSDLYLALDRNPNLDLGTFLRQQPEAFSVTVPGGHWLDLVRRYPWLMTQRPMSPPAAYEIAFTASGFPVRVRPLDVGAGQPSVRSVAATVERYGLATNGLLAERGGAYTLTQKGLRYLELLTTPAASLGPRDTPGVFGDGREGP
jgi:murein DD-endopeptidase MepM/ murein hydrolase activator NlpD